MADQLRVDPVALQHGSNQMFDAVGEAALDFISHDDKLADAAPGWIGSSQLALPHTDMNELETLGSMSEGDRDGGGIFYQRPGNRGSAT